MSETGQVGRQKDEKKLFGNKQETLKSVTIPRQKLLHFKQIP